MSEPLPIDELRLTIIDGDVKIDVLVDGRWRRILHTFHGGMTDHWLSRGSMDVGHFGTVDVTGEYHPIEGEET